MRSKVENMTKNHPKFVSSERKLNFDDVYLVPQFSSINSRKSVNLIANYTLKNGIPWEGIPLIASNMDYIGTLEMASTLQKFQICTAVSKFVTPEEWIGYIDTGLNLNYAFPTFGLDDKNYVRDYINHVQDSTGQLFRIIVLDVPNGYIANFASLICELKTELPEVGIFAGNVVTPEGVELLAAAGVDGVKLGIGSGSVCTTSVETGVGYPQLSAILDSAEAAANNNLCLISDGGITTSGDLGKAFVAGTDFIMIGGILAGHSEGGAPTITENDIEYRLYYGMSSEEAMNTHYDGIAEYRTPEGISKLVRDKGSVENTIRQLLGGLRSTCTYLDCHTVSELPSKGQFIRI